MSELFLIGLAGAVARERTTVAREIERLVIQDGGKVDILSFSHLGPARWRESIAAGRSVVVDGVEDDRCADGIRWDGGEILHVGKSRGSVFVSPVTPVRGLDFYVFYNGFEVRMNRIIAVEEVVSKTS